MSSMELPRQAWRTVATVHYRRNDGSTGTVLCADVGGPDVTYHVDYYRGIGYVVDRIERVDICNACGGTGKRGHKRNAYRRVPCEACKGIGERAARTETLQREN